MPKVSTLKYELDGSQYATNVNCNSSGMFTANLPVVVAQKLNIDRELGYTNLRDLEKDFYAIIERYKAANTTQELLIAIRYGANGRYDEHEDGSVLFGSNSALRVSLSFSHENSSLLLFDFKIICKETVDTVTNYYKTRLGKDFPHWSDNQYKHQHDNPDKYFKIDGEKFSFSHNRDVWKLIPFSDQALQSLTQAQSKIRALSEFLYNFISQDEKMIEQTLLKNKLLN